MKGLMNVTDEMHQIPQLERLAETVVDEAFLSVEQGHFCLIDSSENIDLRLL